MNGFEYEKVKDRVVFKILDMELNTEKLEELLYDEVGNGFAMTFAIILGNDEKQVCVADVTREMAEAYGYDVKELRKNAEYNMFWLFPAILRKLDGEEIGFDPDEKDRESQENEDEIYVLTNGVVRLGASCLYYPAVCELAANRLNSSFYVLPTSTYEHMILPDRGGYEPAGLEEMLREVNDGEIRKEDILSDKVLYYNRVTKKLYRPLNREREEKQREVISMQKEQKTESRNNKEAMRRRLNSYKEKMEEKKHVKQRRI